jgi:hypothetical protein
VRPKVSEEQRDFVKVGFIFSAALVILCGVVGDDWQSDEIFKALGVYPFGLGFLVWPAAGYVLASARSNFGRSLCLTAVTFYDYWVFERLTAAGADGPSPIARLWSYNRLGLIALVAFYVCGQLVLVLPKLRARAGERVRR